jgi:hypothetical protein
MYVDDCRTRVIAVISGPDDLVRLLGQIGVLGLALEIARLSDGNDYFSLAGHVQ